MVFLRFFVFLYGFPLFSILLLLSLIFLLHHTLFHTLRILPPFLFHLLSVSAITSFYVAFFARILRPSTLAVVLSFSFFSCVFYYCYFFYLSLYLLFAYPHWKDLILVLILGSKIFISICK